MATQYAPARCTPDAAAQLQPIPCTYGAQRALLPIAVGALNINELMNINDVRESAMQVDLLTLKVVSESRVTWANFGLPGPLCMFSSYSRCKRQTDIQTSDSIIAECTCLDGGGITSCAACSGADATCPRPLRVATCSSQPELTAWRSLRMYRT